MDLFDAAGGSLPPNEALAPGAMILRGFALARAALLLEDLKKVEAHAPFRQMLTPGGFRMSVAMTNCGQFGWVTDRSGYRYDAVDPQTGAAWPAMPASFAALAADAASAAGCGEFVPDACLVNRYEPGARMSLHQDRNERDFGQPIVSVSLGVPATFLFGGLLRSDKPSRVRVAHGDVVVWGGPARLNFHGIMPLRHDDHPLLGAQRINLTLRKSAAA